MSIEDVYRLDQAVLQPKQTERKDQWMQRVLEIKDPDGHVDFETEIISRRP